MPVDQIAYRTPDFDHVGSIELPEPKIKGRAILRDICQQAFDQSILAWPRNDWYGLVRNGSVLESLKFQLMYMGDEKRDFGGVSFLTHLMEVTDRVYNCPELGDCPPEYLAFISVNHDLEDLCKKYRLQPYFLRGQALAFLSPDCDFRHAAGKDLYLLMDPPQIKGDDRRQLQIDRIPSMSLAAQYVRFFDKYCTYVRDLDSMRRRDPATGKPFLVINNETAAKAFRAKMDKKQEVVFNLPIDKRYHQDWIDLRQEIDTEIDRQLRNAKLRNAFTDTFRNIAARFRLRPSNVTFDIGRRSFVTAAAFGAVVLTAIRGGPKG